VAGPADGAVYDDHSGLGVEDGEDGGEEHGAMLAGGSAASASHMGIS
jgi:hypothetical protein